MTDPLDDNTPLVGITEDDSRPAPTDQDTLLGRLIDPQPVDDAATRRGDVPGIATGFVGTLSGQSAEGEQTPTPTTAPPTTRRREQPLSKCRST